MRKKISLDLQTAYDHLLGQPLKLFKYVHGIAFTRGLPPSNILQDSVTASIFKKAIMDDGISDSNYKNENKELRNALQNIWHNGWLHAEKSNNDVRYVFASNIHHW